MDLEQMNQLIVANQQELEDKLLSATDRENIKDIIDIFNLNIKKKDVIRNAKLSELQDKIYSQMEKRVTEHPDMFNNQDLLNYYKVVQETLNRSIGKDEDSEIPKIQINQQSIHLENSKSMLNRDSRAKVLDVVNSILNDSNDLDIDDFITEDENSELENK